MSPAAPYQSLDDLVMNYFVANYVMKDSGPCPGVFSYTGRILADSAGDAELVRVAIRAVSFAGLGSTTGSDSIMRSARTNYIDAIKRVNMTLVDSRANNDSTIFAVMVLGLFESITCSCDESFEAWKHHINGVASLLVHRGAAQFRTKVGLQIFGEAISYVITLCWQYDHPVPPRLRFLRGEVEHNKDGKSPSWILGTVHMEGIDLYNEVRPDQGTAFLAGTWKDLLSRAVKLDQLLENLFAQLPESWHFETVTDNTADPSIVFQGKYHIYYNTWIAKMWNGMRACRILLNEVIRCLLLREGLMWAPREFSDGGFYVKFQRASDVMTVMRDDILASVPQMLGFIQHEATTGLSYVIRCSSTSTHFVPASGAYFIIWYLYLAGSLLLNAPETREWIVNRLHSIRSMTGIQKAAYLAKLIEKDTGHLNTTLSASQFHNLGL